MEQGTGEGKGLFTKVFWLWLSLAGVATVTCWLGYFLVQQDIRQSANYPQSLMAEDTTSSSDPLGGTLINVSTSLAPFVSIFDASGNLIQSNAVLGGTTPVPPRGVFAYADTYGEDRFTWEPQTGVRIATVLVYHPYDIRGGNETASTTGFFVLSGRSLRDVETLESQLADDTFFAWIFLLVVTCILSIFIAKAFGAPRRHKLPDREKKPDEKINKAPTPQPKAVAPAPPAPPIPPAPPMPPVPPPPPTPIKVPPPVKVAPPVAPPPRPQPRPVPVPPPVQLKPFPVPPAAPPTPISPLSATPSIVLPTSPSDMSPVYYSRTRQPIPPPSLAAPQVAPPVVPPATQPIQPIPTVSSVVNKSPASPPAKNSPLNKITQ